MKSKVFWDAMKVVMVEVFRGWLHWVGMVYCIVSISDFDTLGFKPKSHSTP